MSLEYLQLESLRKNHPAWRLLMAEHAPLIISFLQHVFITPNIRVMSQADLASKLEDLLYQLRDQFNDENLFPKPAQSYLNDWAQPEKGWLSKFYPPASDEAHFDLTPSTEKAISWLNGLTENSFVGTESRLLTVFELLKQIVAGVETDKVQRIKELQQRQQDIQIQIDELNAGKLVIMDDTAVKDRFIQVTNTARDLLGDFRSVEQNFRQLDRKVREDIATWNGPKGELLNHIFGDRDAIADSDQGKSFRAFWDFLMSPASQQELTELLEQVFELPALSELTGDQRLKLIHYDWLEAGEHTQRTVAKLSQQLRRYLDDQAWLENKRIMQILEGISHQAIDIREHMPTGTFMNLDQSSPDIHLPMERPLFSPPLKSVLTSTIETATGEDIDSSVLFEQVYVDKARLHSNINQQLQTSDQVTLSQVIAQHPLQLGLSELVTYLALAGDNHQVVFDEEVQEQVTWTDAEGIMRNATLPRIIFNRQQQTH
ncbi:MAG: DUF3375 domain-containing protein [Gammaproteobacteria bacterium]|nr:DUF3375 domain-containing protein [Gammaproteobacteria bacterium]